MLQEYAPLDPYLDGILRFGGGYSNMLGSNASNPEQRNEVFDAMRNYSAAVAAINAKSAGKDTCVFVPPPQQGLGCKWVAHPPLQTWLPICFTIAERFVQVEEPFSNAMLVRHLLVVGTSL